MSNTQENTIKAFKRILEAKGVEFYIQHLRIINAVVPVRVMLRSKELEVLAHFMNLKGELYRTPFESTGRKIVRQALGLSHSGLTNHLEALYKKGYITSKGADGQIRSIFRPVHSNQLYNFTLNLVE